MGINGIGSESVMVVPPVNVKSSGGNDAQIRALEQKLQQLNNDKKTAERNGDTDSVKQLEKQILKIQQELQKLKSEETNSDDEKIEQRQKEADEELARDPSLGNYVDKRL